MRIAAIYCIWDDQDMFIESVKNIYKCGIDGVVLVYSQKSNFDEDSYIPGYFHSPSAWDSFLFSPDMSKQPAENERNKRNFALDKTRELGYTHFIMLDADEFYEPEAFKKELERFHGEHDLSGLVCGLTCYFKSPSLRVPDKTLVPFIHKLTPELKFQWNTSYPFAFDGPKREIRIDPTRQMNINSGVEWSNIVMHHMSWVRSDIKKKIRNSTARSNIERSTILADYCQAKPGYYCEFYKATLEECDNLFNIPEIVDNDVCKGLPK